MKLVLTLENPTNGYWDGGPKQVFDFSIENPFRTGDYVRIGSWTANFWFTVKRGKTERQTLSYAKKRLRHLCKMPIKSLEIVEGR